MFRINILLFALFFTGIFNAQILNGPMIGHVTHHEATLWVQTTKKENIEFAYRIVGSNQKWNYTPMQVTHQNEAYVCKSILGNLMAGIQYEYRVVLNGKIQAPIGVQSFETSAQWAYRTEPKDFTFALGSCTYVNEETTDRNGKPYGGEYKIFEEIANQSPNFMLWLGDNVYLRESDWTSKSGIEHRYSHTRNIKEMKRLLANCPQYAIWDDHDFGPNNSDGSFINKALTKEAFDLFWANPSMQPEGLAGITNQYDWSDCHFFLLDNRYYRAPNDRKDGERTILGKEQLEWFKNALLNSPATFKFVAIGGQFLNTAPVFENYSANGYAKERQEIIDFIYLHQIKNVIFLTGDRHHSELSVLRSENNPTIYDLTISPLTSGVHDASNEENTLRVENSHVASRNFGIVRVFGEGKNRSVEIKVLDADGKQFWVEEIVSE